MLKIILLFFAIIIYISILNGFGLDYYITPDLLASGENYLLSDSPASAYYQPAKDFSGVSLSHSSPYGFSELDIFSLAAQYEQISAGSFILDNSIISEKIGYIGYYYGWDNINMGLNIRYFSQEIAGYDRLEAFTGNLGIIWENEYFTNGFTYSNITNSSVQNIEIPSVWKYEGLFIPFEKTAFGIGLEKEKGFEMRYSFSVRQSITDTFLLYTGFLSNPSQFSAGLGININRVGVIYGVRTHEYLDYTQGIGVVYEF